MSNVTLSIPEDLIKQGRNYARRHATSLNALIRELLRTTVARNEKGWLDEAFRIADKQKLSVRPHSWKREDAYDV
jgi:plasmid stability protein